MNRWGKIPPNKIAVEQMDSAAAFEQQDKVKILKKKCMAPRLPIHLEPWIEKCIDQITR